MMLPLSFDLQCPYCYAGNDVCHDDGAGYDEDVNHEMQCRSCKNYFTFNTAIIRHYEPKKADCLNGGKHEFCSQPAKRFGLCDTKYYDQCKNCEYESPLRSQP